MTSGSLQGAVLARLEKAPEARCLAFYRSQESLRWLSREEVHQRAAGLACELELDRLRPGDVCVIALPSGEPSAAALLATLLRGAVPLLVAPPAPVGANRAAYDTLRIALRRTRAALAICAPAVEADVARLRRLAASTRFVVAPNRLPDARREPLVTVLPPATDVAVMQLTSGTTAAPRICVWDHRAVLAALDGMAAAMGVSPGDVCLNWTPLYHDMGLVNNFLLCLVHGVPLALLSPHDFIRRPALWLRGLSDTRGTITWSPNFGFAITSRKAEPSELHGVRLDHVRAFWNAAERIHLDTLDTFYRRFMGLGVRRDALKTNYGCAEAVGGSTFSALDRAPRYEHIDRRFLDERGIARPVSALTHACTTSVVSTGHPKPGSRVHILSSRGRALPDGRVGEICLDTPSRMLGYHQDARETGRAFRGGLLHTGDLGYLRDGELFWVGRLRERIRVHGKTIDPSAFEAVLASIPGVREGCFVAFGVPGGRGATDRVIVVTEVRCLHAVERETPALAIRRACSLQLGIVPDDVVLVSPGTLAKTSSGKRRHRYFRRRYLAGRLDGATVALDEVALVPAQWQPA